MKECEENCPQIQQIKERLPLFSLSCSEKADGGIKKSVKKNRKLISNLSKFLKKHTNKSPDRNVLECHASKTENTDIHFSVKSFLSEGKSFLEEYSVKTSLGNDNKVIQEYRLAPNGNKSVKFNGTNFIYSPLYETSEEGEFVIVTRNAIMPFTVILKFNESKNKMEVFAICVYNKTYFKKPQKFQIIRIKNKHTIQPPTEKTETQKESEEESGWLDKLINVAVPRVEMIKKISSPKVYEEVVKKTTDVINDTKNNVIKVFGKEKSDSVSTKHSK